MQSFYKIGTRKWPGCQLHASVAFTPRDIPGSHLCKRSSRHQCHSAEVTTQLGIETTTVWPLARCPNLYLTTHNTHNRQTSMTPVGFGLRNLYLTTHNTHNKQTSMPPVGFGPRNLYLTTHNTHNKQTNIYAPGGVRT